MMQYEQYIEFKLTLYYQLTKVQNPVTIVLH
jgi:hypothetical protein